jgi:hypothetical protein
MGEMEQQHKKSLEHYRNSLDLYKVIMLKFIYFTGNTVLLLFYSALLLRRELFGPIPIVLLL